MIETIFVALWIVIFALLCVAIRRAIRQRERASRHDHIQALRRFTGEVDRPRRRRRSRAASYEPAAA
jgi:hypothetical protein